LFLSPPSQLLCQISPSDLLQGIIENKWKDRLGGKRGLERRFTDLLGRARSYAEVFWGGIYGRVSQK